MLVTSQNTIIIKILELFFKVIFQIFIELRDGMMEHKNIGKVAVVVAQQIESQARNYWSIMSKIAPGLNIQLSNPKW